MCRPLVVCESCGKQFSAEEHHECGAPRLDSEAWMCCQCGNDNRGKDTYCGRCTYHRCDKKSAPEHIGS